MIAPQSPLAFCPVLDEMVRTGSTIGQSGKTLDVSATSTVNNLLTIRNLHLALGAGKTLETGFLRGGSCLVFTQTHKDLGMPPGNQHVAIDPYQRSPFNDSCGLLAIERAGLSSYLDFREETAYRVLPLLLRDAGSFSLVYIDGSHCFEDVFVDMFYSAQLLETGGVVLFDDSQDPHVRKMIRYIRRNLRHCLEEFDLRPYHPGKSIRYRVALALGRVQLTGFKKVGALHRPYGH